MSRFILLSLFILFLDLYTFQAIKYTTGPVYEPVKWVIFAIYWGISIVSLFFIFYFGTQTSGRKVSLLVTTLRSLLVILAFGKLIILLGVIIDDLRRAIVFLLNSFTPLELTSDRSIYILTMFIFLAIIPVIMLTYGMIRNPYRYTIFSEKINSPKWPSVLDGLRIVQISDIHSGSFNKNSPIHRAVDMINDLQPDLVFFTGDLVNNQAHEIEPYIPVLSQIKAKYGIYSVLGNHDYGDYVRWPDRQAKAANLKRLIRNHELLGWRLLLNDHEIINIDGVEIAIIGVENFSANGRFTRYGNLPMAYAGTEAVDIKLLLSHDPSHWKYEVTEKFSDILVTFSGHTHGMQFGIEVAKKFKWSPIKYVYNEWAGLYERANQYLYVNRGFGYLGYPGRVGILPEITSINFFHKKMDISKQ